MMNFIRFNKGKKYIACLILPWIAMILSIFPYTRKRSLFLDRLIVLSERQ